MKVFMIHRRHAGTALRALAVAGFVAIGGAAAAQDRVPQHIVNGLIADGFTIESAHRTWLGRVRVLARDGDTVREVVYVPTTGEILRDYSETQGPNGQATGFWNGNNGNNGNAFGQSSSPGRSGDAPGQGGSSRGGGGGNSGGGNGGGGGRGNK